MKKLASYLDFEYIISNEIDFLKSSIFR